MKITSLIKVGAGVEAMVVDVATAWDARLGQYAVGVIWRDGSDWHELLPASDLVSAAQPGKGRALRSRS